MRRARVFKNPAPHYKWKSKVFPYENLIFSASGFQKKCSLKSPLILLYQVGEAFLRLLSHGESGCVTSVWRNTPPYSVPDTSMPTFVLWTVAAMAFKFWPRYAQTHPFKSTPLNLMVIQKHKSSSRL